MKPSEIAKALACCVDAKQPVITWGAPGIGKSQVTQQTSALLNRRLIDVRAALLDPVDLRGIPNVRDGKTHWNAPAFLPSDNVPSLILLDELNRAPVMTQNALFQLVLDRKLGEYTLPDTCEIVACCNRESDGGGVVKMPQALANRFAHLTMEADLDDWCKWAVGQGNIEPAVIAFLRFRSDLLHQFSRTERAFPTPRSWEFVSRVTGQHPGNGIEHALYAGTVGDGAAVEYSAFLRLFRELPNIDAILLNPATSPVPTGPASMFAVSAALARRANVTNFGRALEYIARMPKEYGVYAVKDATRRDQTLAATPEFTKWSFANADVVF